MLHDAATGPSTNAETNQRGDLASWVPGDTGLKLLGTHNATH